MTTYFPLFTGFCKILCKMVKSPMKRDMEISQTTNEMGHIAYNTQIYYINCEVKRPMKSDMKNP